MDGKNRDVDNIFTEWLWRSLKYDEVYLHKYTLLKEARHGIHRYFEFYNHYRPHQSLDYRTPASVYTKWCRPQRDKLPRFAWTTSTTRGNHYCHYVDSNSIFGGGPPPPEGHHECNSRMISHLKNYKKQSWLLVSLKTPRWLPWKCGLTRIGRK